jgi:transposase
MGLRNENLTLDRIRAVLEEKEVIISRATLQRVLHKLGFSYRRVKGHDIWNVMERIDVVHARTQYLREIEQYRRAGFDVVWMDETWINANHCCARQWMHDVSSLQSPCHDCRKRRIPSGKGPRLVILDAGNADGFIEGVGRIFEAHGSGDHHDSMNTAYFMDWWEHCLLPALKKPSVVVLDNAKYHNPVVEKSPTGSWKKGDIIAWLQKKGLPADPSLTKVELMKIVVTNRPPKLFLSDVVADRMGHCVLRTPIRHPMLNPIELVWAYMKHQVAAANNLFNMKGVKMLYEKAHDEVTPEYWRKCIGHVEKVEEQFRKLTHVDMSMNGSIVISLGEESEDEDTSDDEPED